jgi:hypothetical protein
MPRVFIYWGKFGRSQHFQLSYQQAGIRQPNCCRCSHELHALESEKVANLSFIANAGIPTQIFCGTADNVFNQNKSYAMPLTGAARALRFSMHITAGMATGTRFTIQRQTQIL